MLGNKLIYLLKDYFCVISFRLMTSGSLLIISPSLEDEGYFECKVTNEVGEERRVIEVMLQGRTSTNPFLNVTLQSAIQHTGQNYNHLVLHLTSSTFSILQKFCIA